MQQHSIRDPLHTFNIQQFAFYCFVHLAAVTSSIITISIYYM